MFRSLYYWTADPYPMGQEAMKRRIAAFLTFDLVVLHNTLLGGAR